MTHSENSAQAPAHQCAAAVISPSQIALFRACPLAWHRRHAQRLPEVQRRRTDLGERVHAVLARWIAREDMMPMRPEEVLAPEIVEAATIAYRAVAAGVIRPGPAWVEYDLGFDLDCGAEIRGRVDALYPIRGRPEVHDHKTFGPGGQKYLRDDRSSSSLWIGADDKMLVYAAMASRLGGWCPVVVRHNQIPTGDHAEPRFVEAELPAARLRAEWERVEADAALMLALAAEPEDEVGHVWYSDPCRRCDFAGLCGGDETLEQYRARAAAPPPGEGEVFA